MTTWFVSRHPGAIDWLEKTGIKVDRYAEHLSSDDVAFGDFVYGVLPLHIISDICSKGARFFALDFSMNASQRGKDLTKSELDSLNCKLQEYIVIKKESTT